VSIPNVKNQFNSTFKNTIVIEFQRRAGNLWTKLTHKNEEPYPYAGSSVEAESLLRHPPHSTGKILLVLYMKVRNRSGVCI
jgi:hypothetical protein